VTSGWELQNTFWISARDCISIPNQRTLKAFLSDTYHLKKCSGKKILIDLIVGFLETHDDTYDMTGRWAVGGDVTPGSIDEDEFEPSGMDYTYNMDFNQESVQVNVNTNRTTTMIRGGYEAFDTQWLFSGKISGSALLFYQWKVRQPQPHDEEENEDQYMNVCLLHRHDKDNFLGSWYGCFVNSHLRERRIVVAGTCKITRVSESARQFDMVEIPSCLSSAKTKW